MLDRPAGVGFDIFIFAGDCLINLTLGAGFLKICFHLWLESASGSAEVEQGAESRGGAVVLAAAVVLLRGGGGEGH